MQKKIDAVEIHNFQSHSDTTITLAPLLTTIVGASDAGKSSIIRAIRWALFNEPSGTQYMRVGTQDTYVRLTFSDGSTLLRARDKSSNYYILLEPGKEPMRMEGFGQKAPAEIFAFTGIRRVPISEKEALSINISSQLEGPFLLGETPTVRAESIGRLAGTHQIDIAHRAARADRNQNTRQINLLLEEKKQLEEQLAPYSDLDSFAKRIEALSSLELRIKQLRTQQRPLKELRNRWYQVSEQHSQWSTILARYENLDVGIQKTKSAQDMMAILSQLQRIRVEIRNCSMQIRQISNALVTIKQFLSFVESSDLLQTADRWKQAHVLKKRLEMNLVETNRMRIESSFPVQELQMIRKRAEELESQSHRLREIQKNHQDILQKIEIGNTYMNMYEKTLSLKKHVERVEETEIRKKRIQDIHQKWMRLAPVLQHTRADLENLSNEFDHCTQEYLKIFEKSGICPYCMQSIDADSLAHIRSHIEAR